jgi:hypothetical protein
MLPLLPPGKEIIIYSRNGFESAYATAFLRLMGYDAHTLLNGMNAFTTIQSQGQGTVFGPAEIQNFPLDGTDASGIRSHVPEFKMADKPAAEAKNKPAPKPRPKPVLKPAPADEDEGC